jgi:spermidine synthase
LSQLERVENVLLVSGGFGETLVEIAKHHPERVDYVEQDPALVSFVESFLSAAARASLWDPRVRIETQDAGSFLRRRSGAYDVVLMNVGEPINAQMNRFYTEETFRLLAEHLRPDGILSFSVPGGGDMVGPTHARLLGSLHQTLLRVFPAVRVVPGERARFFAAHNETSLLLEPQVLAGRIEERGLDLVHVRWDTLDDLLSPMRRDYLSAVLADFEDSPVNRQFAPVCYFHGMMVWAAQWHPAWGGWIERVAAARPLHLFVGVGALGSLLILGFWLGEPRYRAAVGVSVLVQGAWGMVLQVVLILGFQILAGFAYLQLALILAFFMAGLAGGTLAIALASRRWPRTTTAVSWLAVAQVGITLLPLALLVLFSPLGLDWRERLSPTGAAWAFTAVSFLAGLLGGSHFALAALASVATGARPERTGGYLYAIDLLGAAGGALLAGLLLLPLYGVPNTLMLLSLLSAICLAALLRRPTESTAGAGR